MLQLPTVLANELEAAKADDWEYLSVLLDAYAQQVQPEVPFNSLASFAEAPCILILYNDLCGQVNNGGFIQLIQNGCGPNIFDNPFFEDLACWGATQLAALTAQARDIYHANRHYLERERTLPEFSQLYSEFTQFSSIEDTFYEVEASQTALVRAYVAGHLGQFAR
ncbi:MAG: DUF4375 domain-containing protein, partial [Hymenobacter sp.]